MLYIPNKYHRLCWKIGKRGVKKSWGKLWLREEKLSTQHSSLLRIINCKFLQENEEEIAAIMTGECHESETTKCVMRNANQNRNFDDSKSEN